MYIERVKQSKAMIPFDFIADEDVIQRNDLSQLVKTVHVLQFAVELGAENQCKTVAQLAMISAAITHQSQWFPKAVPGR